MFIFDPLNMNKYNLYQATVPGFATFTNFSK